MNTWCRSCCSFFSLCDFQFFCWGLSSCQLNQQRIVALSVAWAAEALSVTVVFNVFWQGLSFPLHCLGCVVRCKSWGSFFCPCGFQFFFVGVCLSPLVGCVVLSRAGSMGAYSVTVVFKFFITVCLSPSVSLVVMLIGCTVPWWAGNLFLEMWSSGIVYLVYYILVFVYLADNFTQSGILRPNFINTS